MANEELVALPVTKLSAMLKAKEVSPVELTEAYLERIERLDGDLHAYITVDAKGALAAAKQAEGELAKGSANGLLAGVPIAVKDQMDAKGLPTTMGTSFIKDVAGEDSTLVARLKDQGAILLGKLNLSEFAMGGNVVHPHGTPRNPWDRERQPGHSSSGSGIAVAASLAAAAIGEDTAGSIRIPASWCGVTGLRPTWGRFSRYRVASVSWSMDQAGPMTKTVEDCALVFQAVAGHDPKDATTSQAAVPSFQARDGLNGLRVAIVREAMESPALDAETKAGVEQAAKELEALGAAVTDISIPLFTNGGLISAAVTDADVAYVHRHLLREHAAEYDTPTRRRLMAGMLMPTELRDKALRFRVIMRRLVMEAFAQVDVLVTPTQSTPAPLISTNAGGFGSVEEVLRGFYGVRGATGPFNLAAVPALSVPCGFTKGGLPMGLQLAARPFDELTLFQTGHAYQERTSWHTRWPEL